MRDDHRDDHRDVTNLSLGSQLYQIQLCCPTFFKK